ncbi:MAG: class I SAM-dependent methyltransferase [Pseudomonadales bacterium]
MGSPVVDTPLCVVHGEGADETFLRRLLALDVCIDGRAQGSGESAHTLQLRYARHCWVFELPGTRARIAVDFAAAGFPARLRASKVAAEGVVRAVRGRNSAVTPLLVLDATAGFGRDALLLAAAGCEVHLCERLPLLALLLEHALAAAARCDQPELRAAATRCSSLRSGDSVPAMQNWRGSKPDIVYLDPMYSASAATGRQGLKRSAAVNKQMRALQCIDALYAPRLSPSEPAALLETALQLARQKVVVKRPPAAAALAGRIPASSISSKAVRFDVYPV